jgi:hypothetical protein
MLFQEQANFLNAVIGEGQNAVVIIEAVDPDETILGFQGEGEVVDEELIDAELPGDARDGVDVVGLVTLRAHAAAGSDAGWLAFSSRLATGRAGGCCARRCGRHARRVLGIAR